MSLRVFCLFYKNKQNVSRSSFGLSSSRYDFMGFLSNPMKSLELTKCCFNVTSSVLFVLQKTSKMYREVRLGCRVLDTMARLSPLHHSNWQSVASMSLRVFCLFWKNKQNVSRSKMRLVEFSIQFQGISFESHEITRTDKVLHQCYFEPACVPW